MRPICTLAEREEAERAARRRDRNIVDVRLARLFLCMTGWIGPIGNAARVTGLIVAVLMGYLPHRFRRTR